MQYKKLEPYLNTKSLMVKLTNSSDGAKQTEIFNNLKKSVKGLKDEEVAYLAVANKLDTQQQRALLISQGLSDKNAKRLLSTAESANPPKKYSDAVKDASIAQKGFFNSLSSGTKLLFGFTVATTALSVGLKIWEDYKQKQEAMTQSIRDNAIAAAEESNQITQLLSRYNQLNQAIANNQASKTDLVSTQNSLLNALGIEASQVDTLIKKYGNLDTAINTISLDKLKEQQPALRAGLMVAENDLIRAAQKTSDTYGIGDFDPKTVEKLKNIQIEGLNFSLPGEYDSIRTAYLHSEFDTSTPEGILAKQKALKKFNQELFSILKNEQAIDDFIGNGYQQIFNADISAVDAFADTYQFSKSTTNNNPASALIEAELITKGSPSSMQDFLSFRDDIEEAALASKDFVGSQEDIKAAVTNTLATLPEMQVYLDNLKLAPERFNLLTVSDSLSSLYDSSISDNLRQYLNDIADLGDTSSLTADKIKELAQENELISIMLGEVGMSASFAAKCMRDVASGNENGGFSSITQSALLLDQVLSGLDGKLDSVVAAKSRYDQALSKDDYNSQFQNTSQAYQNVKTGLEHGEYGKHTRAGLEYLFGEQSYDWSAEVAKQKLEDYESLWSGANGSGINSYLANLQAEGKMQDWNSSVTDMGDGQYEINLDPAHYTEMANAIGITEEAFLAAIEASKMYGNTVVFHSGELEDALAQVGFSIKDTSDQTIISTQTLERHLAAIGKEGYEISNIMKTVADMKSVVTIDFDIQNKEEATEVLKQLRESTAIQFNGENDIDISSLASTLTKDLGMTMDEVENFITQIREANSDIRFSKETKSGRVQLSEQGVSNFLESMEVDTENSGLVKVGSDAEASALQVQDLETLLQLIENHDMQVTVTGLEQIAKAAQEASSNFSTLQSYFNNGLSTPTGASPTSGNSVTGNTNTGTPGKKRRSSWQGSAFSQGSWGIGYTGKSLVGELGRELVVRGSRYFTVGDNGAEFVPLKSNDIIFNHRQTESLLNNGRITSRGKAYATGSADITDPELLPNIKTTPGNAFASGSAEDLSIDWFEHSIKLESERSSSLRKNASSSSLPYLGLAAAELEKATAIIQNADGLSNILESDMTRLQQIAKEAGMSLFELFRIIENGGYNESRRSYLAQIMESDERQLANYEAAIKQYQADYEALISELTPEMRQKIEEGSLSVDTLSEEEKEKAEKAIDAFNKVQDHKSEKRDLELEQLEHIKDYYDNEMDYLDQQAERIKNSTALIEAQMDYLKASGQIITDASYYQLIENNKREAAILDKQIALKKAELAKLMSRKDFDTNSEDYLTLKQELDNLELAEQQLLLAQEQLRNDILNLPIENIDILLSMYDSVIDSIKQWSAQMEASGRKVDRNYYQMLIGNGMEIIDQYREQARLVRNLMDEYEEGSDNWNTLYTKLQGINSAMSSMVENLYKWNEALLQIPMDTVNEFTDKLQKAVSAMASVQNDYNTVISAVTGALKEQIDLINEERDLHKDNYDTQIDVLQERLELLRKQNEALRVQSAYEQALYDLQTANTQKTERVIRDGEIVYETNADNLRNAEESLQDAMANLTQYELEKEIEGLQDELEAINDRYDEQIESLEKISEKWSEIADKISTAKDEAIASEILGAGWKDAVLGGNDEAIFSMFSGMYQTLSEQIDQYEEQITSTENIQALLEDYINAYKEGTITYEQATLGINDLLSQLNKQMSSMDNLDNVLDFLAQTTGSEANAGNVLSSIQDLLNKTGEELVASLEQYNENADLIAGYTTSWEQLTIDVGEIKNILEDVRDNLDDALDELVNMQSRDIDDDDDDDDDFFDNAFGSGASIGAAIGGAIGGSAGAAAGAALGAVADAVAGAVSDAISDTSDDIPSYANGISNGLIGSPPTTERARLMKLFSTRNITDPAHAVPIIAHEGEAVLNREQQNTLLENLATAWNYAPIPSMPNYSGLSTTGTAQSNASFTFGDIRIEKCDNPDQLAEGILKGGLRSAVMQQIGKRH